MVAGAGKLCVGRLGDDRQFDNNLLQSVSSYNCCVSDDAMLNGAEYELQDELDDDVKGGGGNDLEDRFSGEEGPRGTDELGLEKSRAGERRLCDDGLSDSS